MSLLQTESRPGIEEPLAWIAAQVDRLFEQRLAVPPDPSARLFKAMRHAAIGGGKRLRPLLVCASADLFGVPRSSSLRAGLAVECIHVHSLIHDDLPCMDDDDLRRGKPTVHVAYDEATAVLAGDSLLAPSITRRLIEDFVRRPAPGEASRAMLAALTKREIDVLRRIACGLNNRQIAADLFLSEATVKTHVNRIHSKLRVRDRAQAVIAAYESGLVRPGGS